MPTVYLVSATFGDHVPGHELADPDCPSFPGLLDRPEVNAWLDQMGYGDDETELVYLVTEDDPGMIPRGFEYITVEV